MLLHLIFSLIMNVQLCMFPGGYSSSINAINIPQDTPVDILCRINGNNLACVIVRYANGSETCTEIHLEPVELVPGIVAIRDRPLTSILLTVNISKTEVVDGLGCAGTSNNKIIFNVKIFGEFLFFMFH